MAMHFLIVLIYNVLILKIKIANQIVLHSVVHNIKIYMYKDLTLNVHKTSSFLVLHLHHIIFKTQTNACNQNQLTSTLYKMIHIISKYNVHNLIYIILINISHINVQNNVHLTHILHIMHFIIIVLLSALLMFQKTKLNIVLIHLNVFNNIRFYQKINHTA